MPSSDDAWLQLISHLIVSSPSGLSNSTCTLDSSSLPPLNGIALLSPNGDLMSVAGRLTALSSHHWNQFSAVNAFGSLKDDVERERYMNAFDSVDEKRTTTISTATATDTLFIKGFELPPTCMLMNTENVVAADDAVVRFTVVRRTLSGILALATPIEQESFSHIEDIAEDNDDIEGLLVYNLPFGVLVGSIPKISGAKAAFIIVERFCQTLCQ